MAVTSGQLKTAVAAALKVAEASLPSYWDTLVGEALLVAQNNVYSALLGRGYTQAQVEAWDMLDATWKDLGVFWALTKGGALSAFDRKFIEAIDHREMLKNVLLYVDGVWVAPRTESGAPGVPSTGAPDTTSDRVTFARFGPFDSCFPDDGGQC